MAESWLVCGELRNSENLKRKLKPMAGYWIVGVALQFWFRGLGEEALLYVIVGEVSQNSALCLQERQLV